MTKIEGIMLREKEKRLIMSRVPKQTKELFIEIADKEFEGDYGMTLKAILDGFLQSKLYFEHLDLKLDKVMSMIVMRPEEKPAGRKMMSGRIVDKGGEE